MNKVTLVLIYDKNYKNILMLKRLSDPFKGKFNFLGGKTEDGESQLECAIRELAEESGIKDIKLTHFLDFTFPKDQLLMSCFYGVLEDDIELKEEKHPLLWMPVDQDFSTSAFAGYGNIPYLITLSMNYIKRTF